MYTAQFNNFGTQEDQCHRSLVPPVLCHRWIGTPWYEITTSTANYHGDLVLHYFSTMVWTHGRPMVLTLPVNWYPGHVPIAGSHSSKLRWISLCLIASMPICFVGLIFVVCQVNIRTTSSWWSLIIVVERNKEEQLPRMIIIIIIIHFIVSFIFSYQFLA